MFPDLKLSIPEALEASGNDVNQAAVILASLFESGLAEGDTSPESQCSPQSSAPSSEFAAIMPDLFPSERPATAQPAAPAIGGTWRPTGLSAMLSPTANRCSVYNPLQHQRSGGGQAQQRARSPRELAKKNVHTQEDIVFNLTGYVGTPGRGARDRNLEPRDLWEPNKPESDLNAVGTSGNYEMVISRRCGPMGGFDTRLTGNMSSEQPLFVSSMVTSSHTTSCFQDPGRSSGNSMRNRILEELGEAAASSFDFYQSAYPGNT